MCAKYSISSENDAQLYVSALRPLTIWDARSEAMQSKAHELVQFWFSIKAVAMMAAAAAAVAVFRRLRI